MSRLPDTYSIIPQRKGTAMKQFTFILKPRASDDIARKIRATIQTSDINSAHEIAEEFAEYISDVGYGAFDTESVYPEP